MKYHQVFQVENIKCGGCMQTITKGLKHIDSGYDVHMDQSNGTIVIDSERSIDSEAVTHALDQMGYPISGDNNAWKKAKSYVSCAVGRMTS